MDYKMILGWLALNLALLAAVVLIVRGWLRTRPVTGRVLAKRLAQESGTDGQKPDCAVGEIAFLLRETGRPAEGPLLAAVLTSWHARGIITCEMAPKKRLASYGEDMQPAFSFSDGHPPLAGAEGALLALLEDACAGGALQSSEGYNWARENAPRLRDVLRRFEAEGRARLRTEGAVRDEPHRGMPGTAQQERLAYTPRGLRRALALRRWENHLKTAPEDCPVHAVLFGCGQPPQPLGMFCERLSQGYAAGLKSRLL